MANCRTSVLESGVGIGALTGQQDTESTLNLSNDVNAHAIVLVLLNYEIASNCSGDTKKSNIIFKFSYVSLILELDFSI